jgi:hypothetical protein
MSIEEAIDRANQGGYHINGTDGMETSYAGANNEYSVDISIINLVREALWSHHAVLQTCTTFSAL